MDWSFSEPTPPGIPDRSTAGSNPYSGIGRGRGRGRGLDLNPGINSGWGAAAGGGTSTSPLVELKKYAECLEQLLILFRNEQMNEGTDHADEIEDVKEILTDLRDASGGGSRDEEELCQAHLKKVYGWERQYPTIKAFYRQGRIPSPPPPPADGFMSAPLPQTAYVPTPPNINNTRASPMDVSNPNHHTNSPSRSSVHYNQPPIHQDHFSPPPPPPTHQHPFPHQNFSPQHPVQTGFGSFSQMQQRGQSAPGLQRPPDNNFAQYPQRQPHHQQYQHPESYGHFPSHPHPPQYQQGPMPAPLLSNHGVGPSRGNNSSGYPPGPNTFPPSNLQQQQQQQQGDWNYQGPEYGRSRDPRSSHQNPQRTPPISHPYHQNTPIHHHQQSPPRMSPRHSPDMRSPPRSQQFHPSPEIRPSYTRSGQSLNRSTSSGCSLVPPRPSQHPSRPPKLPESMSTAEQSDAFKMKARASFAGIPRGIPMRGTGRGYAGNQTPWPRTPRGLTPLTRAAPSTSEKSFKLNQPRPRDLNRSESEGNVDRRRGSEESETRGDGGGQRSSRVGAPAWSDPPRDKDETLQRVKDRVRQQSGRKRTLSVRERIVEKYDMSKIPLGGPRKSTRGNNTNKTTSSKPSQESPSPLTPPPANDSDQDEESDGDEDEDYEVNFTKKPSSGRDGGKSQDHNNKGVSPANKTRKPVQRRKTRSSASDEVFENTNLSEVIVRGRKERRGGVSLPKVTRKRVRRLIDSSEGEEEEEQGVGDNRKRRRSEGQTKDKGRGSVSSKSSSTSSVAATSITTSTTPTTSSLSRASTPNASLTKSSASSSLSKGAPSISSTPSTSTSTTTSERRPRKPSSSSGSKEKESREGDGRRRNKSSPSTPQFNPTNIIGPRDLICNTGLGKVKMESDYRAPLPEVKREKTTFPDDDDDDDGDKEGDRGSGSTGEKGGSGGVVSEKCNPVPSIDKRIQTPPPASVEEPTSIPIEFNVLPVQDGGEVYTREKTLVKSEDDDMMLQMLEELKAMDGDPKPSLEDKGIEVENPHEKCQDAEKEVGKETENMEILNPISENDNYSGNCKEHGEKVSENDSGNHADNADKNAENEAEKTEPVPDILVDERNTKDDIHSHESQDEVDGENVESAPGPDLEERLIPNHDTHPPQKSQDHENEAEIHLGNDAKNLVPVPEISVDEKPTRKECISHAECRVDGDPDEEKDGVNDTKKAENTEAVPKLLVDGSPLPQHDNLSEKCHDGNDGEQDQESESKNPEENLEPAPETLTDEIPFRKTDCFSENGQQDGNDSAENNAEIHEENNSADDTEKDGEYDEEHVKPTLGILVDGRPCQEDPKTCKGPNFFENSQDGEKVAEDQAENDAKNEERVAESNAATNEQNGPENYEQIGAETDGGNVQENVEPPSAILVDERPNQEDDEENGGNVSEKNNDENMEPASEVLVMKSPTPSEETHLPGKWKEKDSERGDENTFPGKSYDNEGKNPYNGAENGVPPPTNDIPALNDDNFPENCEGEKDEEKVGRTQDIQTPIPNDDFSEEMEAEEAGEESEIPSGASFQEENGGELLVGQDPPTTCPTTPQFPVTHSPPSRSPQLSGEVEKGIPSEEERGTGGGVSSPMVQQGSEEIDDAVTAACFNALSTLSFPPNPGNEEGTVTAEADQENQDIPDENVEGEDSEEENEEYSVEEDGLEPIDPRIVDIFHDGGSRIRVRVRLNGRIHYESESSSSSETESERSTPSTEDENTNEPCWIHPVLNSEGVLEMPSILLQEHISDEDQVRADKDDTADIVGNGNQDINGIIQRPPTSSDSSDTSDSSDSSDTSDSISSQDSFHRSLSSLVSSSTSHDSNPQELDDQLELEQEMANFSPELSEADFGLMLEGILGENNEVQELEQDLPTDELDLVNGDLELPGSPPEWVDDVTRRVDDWLEDIWMSVREEEMWAPIWAATTYDYTGPYGPDYDFENRRVRFKFIRSNSRIELLK